ncbi:MAG: hypothetical protein ACI4WH_08565 [Oscillospiraceae bacterium]
MSNQQLNNTSNALCVLCAKLLNYKDKTPNKTITLNVFFPNMDEYEKESVNLVGKNFEEETNGGSINTLLNQGFESRLSNKKSLGIVFINSLLYYYKKYGISYILDVYDYSFQEVLVPFSKEDDMDYSKTFKDCLDYMYDKKYIYTDAIKNDMTYMDIIYTYIKHNKFNCALFLITSLFMLSPIINNDKNNELNSERMITDNNNNQVNIYDNFQQVCNIINDFQNYQNYIDTKDIVPQKYIPNRQTEQKIIKKETNINNIFAYEHQNFNFVPKSEDAYYFESLLDNPTCKEIHILSRFANSWASGDIYEKLINRLDDGLTVKMLLMDINTPFANFYNDRQNHIKNNPFNIFEDLTKDYPNNFFLKYVTIPLTNRSFEDCSNHKIRVDFLTMPPISKDVFKRYFDRNSQSDKMYYEQYSQQFDELWEKYSRDVHTIYDYSKFSYGIASNVNDKKFYDFYHYCIKNSKNIGVISPTASSWTNYNYLTYKLYEKLQEEDFHIEFIVLRPNTYNFKIALENRKYACTSNIENLDRFKDLIEKYPNQVSVYATDLFISDTITIDFSNQIMRVDNHILNSKSSYDIKPSMIIPNNQTDTYGYYSEYLQQYEFIKNHKDTHKLDPSK